MRKYPKCNVCGAKMTEYDGWAWYTCPNCGNSVRDNQDGTWTWHKEIFGKKAKGDISPEQWRDFEDGWRPDDN